MKIHGAGFAREKRKIVKSFCRGSRGTVFSKRVPLAAGGKKSNLIAVLVMGLVLMAACSGTGQEEVKKESTAEEMWYNLKPVSIPIPENIGGEASLARNIYVIIDGSGSMNGTTTRECGGDQQFSSKIEGARWAIKKFLENVPADVNIGLYVFDLNGHRQVIPLGSSNREAFLKAVDAIEAGGQTPLAQAIRYGTDQLIRQYQRQLGYGEYRLVVVTDGIAEDIPQAALYAAQYGIPIYAIGLCVEANHPLRNFSVSYRAADSFQDLQKGLEATLAELPNYDVTEFKQ